MGYLNFSADRLHFKNIKGITRHMNSRSLLVLMLAQLVFLSSCGQEETVLENEPVIDNAPIGEDQENRLKKLVFIDEYILPDQMVYENTLVGGLSGITYSNGTWVVISDDSKQARGYTLDIAYDLDGFSRLAVNAVIEFKDKTGGSFEEETVDPEAVRIVNDTLIWSSEGNIGAKIDPFVRVASINGDFLEEMSLPLKYSASLEEGKGPRQNGVFEGLSLSIDNKGYWVNTELPLKEDGNPPSVNQGAVVRIAYIDKATSQFGKEFAYPLDAVSRPAINGFSFELNGLVELLEYDEHKFLALERSFSAGHFDGGNTVKLYDVDASNATDVRNLKSLGEANIVPVEKKLLLDFDSIRPQLTNNTVDNIEGLAFGPKFLNGNRSVVVVSDNNFSRLYKQLNQFILLELQE